MHHIGTLNALRSCSGLASFVCIAVTITACGGSDEADEAGSSAPIVVSDGDFASWTAFSVINDNPLAAGTGPLTSTTTATRTATGGNPGAFLSTTITVRLGDGAFAGAVKSDFSYSPATSGALQSLAASVSLAMIDPGESAWQLVIEQSGRRYFSVPYGTFPANGTWNARSATGLTAAQFDTNPWVGQPGVASTGQRPDFSATGAPMRFGIAVGNTIPFGTVATLRHGIDSFSLTISR